jgi:hypothetical protein
MDPIWQQVIAISYYFAVYNAIWRGHAPVVVHMISALDTIVTSANIDWLRPRLTEVKIAAALTLAAAKVSNGKEIAKRFDVSNVLAGLEELDNDFSIVGGTTVKPRSMGVMPIDVAEAQSMSTVSGITIKRGSFVLEDQHSTMAWEEALMWFELTPFSPLPSHRRFMAY